MAPTITDGTMTGMSPTSVNGHGPSITVSATSTQPPSPAASASPADPAPRPTPDRSTPVPVRSRKTQNALTLLVYVIATGAAAEGMWAFFGDTLNITNVWMRGATFAVFEVAVLASALRARSARLANMDSKGGVDGLAVWVLAALSGVFSASHEPEWAGRGVRFVLPLLAAFMFERGTHAEQADRREAAGRRRNRINMRLSPERVLVWVGLADASDRGAADVDRDRRLARLAALSVQANTPGRGQAKAVRRYKQALVRANETLGLANNPKLVAQLRTNVALLYNAEASTTPEAVAPANPWTSRAAGGQGNGRAATSAAAARTAVRVNVRPGNGGGKQRRSAEQLRTDHADLISQHPSRSQEWYADQLGVSARRLRDVINSTQPPPAEEPFRP